MSLDISLYATRRVCVAEANFTHNLVPMWKKAGLYDALYQSEGKSVSEVLPSMRAGVASMRADPQAYMDLDAANGWGTYAATMPCLEVLLAEMESNLDAVIGVYA